MGVGRTGRLVMHVVCVLCFASQYRVVVPKMGMVSDLCSALSKLTGVPAENVRLPLLFDSADGVSVPV